MLVNVTYLPYTGIGSRETPHDILEQEFKLAHTLDCMGFVLRSGAAPGSDTSFELGALNFKIKEPEIYLPWQGFQKHTSNLVFPIENTREECERLAAKYHPNWARLTRVARLFHCRNVYQVLGKDLKSPSLFVACYTKKGKMIGGTSQALRIALDYGIPVFNFGDTKQDAYETCLMQARSYFAQANT